MPHGATDRQTFGATPAQHHDELFGFVRYHRLVLVEYQRLHVLTPKPLLIQLQRLHAAMPMSTKYLHSVNRRI